MLTKRGSNENENQRPHAYSREFGHARPTLLQIEFRDNRKLFLPYSHFLGGEQQSSEELQLLFTAQRIRITGRNLDPICEALAELSLKFIREIPPDQGNDHWPTITRIEVIKTD